MQSVPWSLFSIKETFNVFIYKGQVKNFRFVRKHMFTKRNVMKFTL